MISPSACILPWIHVSTNPSGYLRPCCHIHAPTRDSNGKMFQFSPEGVDAFWNSEAMRTMRLEMLAGKWPKQCASCSKLEASGAASPRISKNKLFEHHLSRLDHTAEDGSAPKHIAYVDLRLGNFCNLRCRMCGPHSSNLLEEEWKKVFPNRHQTILNGDWGDDTQRVIATLQPFMHEIEEIYFVGGEPTIVRSHEPIMEMLINTGAAEKIRLRYSTNATNFPERLLDLWTGFKHVHLSLSVDGVGDLARYIRYPSNWRQIEKNIKRIYELPSERISVSIVCTVQILNILRLADLLDFVATLPNPIMPIFNILHQPVYYDMRLLPSSMKEDVIARLRDWRETHPEVKNRDLGQPLDGVIAHLLSSDLSHHLPAFFHNNDALDNHRGGIKLADILPELEALRCV